MTTIRPYQPQDWTAVWRILRGVFAAGDTYAFPPDGTEAEALRFWIEQPLATWVAVDERDRIMGSYFIRPNHAGAGSHVCNCGYVVSPADRGRGVATSMCEHSQREAVTSGFRAMQFNLVVSTNIGAVRLWESLGFTIVGTLPEAFLHPTRGFVDAFVMYKILG